MEPEINRVALNLKVNTYEFLMLMAVFEPFETHTFKPFLCDISARWKYYKQFASIIS